MSSLLLIVTTCFLEACPKLIVKQGFMRHFPNFIQAVLFSRARGGSQPSTCIDSPLCSISSGAAMLLGQLALSCMGQLPGSGHERMQVKPHWHVKQSLSVPICLSSLSRCRFIVRSRIICGCANIYPPLSVQSWTHYIFHSIAFNFALWRHFLHKWEMIEHFISGNCTILRRN